MEQRLLEALTATEAHGRTYADAMEQRLLQGTAQAIADVEARGRAYADAMEGRIRQDVQAESAETRRHFDVVAEGLRSEIRLVGEGVLTLDQKHDRLREEMHQEFARVDRRILRLEARVLPEEEPS